MNIYKFLIGTTSIPSFNSGGPGKYTNELLNGLRNSNNKRFIFDGVFFKKIYKNGEILSIVDSRGKTSSFLNFIDKFPLLSIFIRKYLSNIIDFRLIKLKILLSKEVYTVINCHDFYLTYLLRNENCKLIFTNHFKGSLYKESLRFKSTRKGKYWEKYFYEIETVAIKRADLIIFPSCSALNLLKEDFPDLSCIIDRKSKILYTGIDDNFESKDIRQENLPINTYKKYVLNIGNHIPDKGVFEALEVFNDIKKIRDDLIFINVGLEGIETNRLYNFIQINGLANDVHFLGKVSFEKIKSLLTNALLVIHMPNRVVFDLALLEAMSSGTAVLSSSAEGNIEALGNDYILIKNKNGYQFDMNLISNENFLLKVGKNLRIRYLEKFTKKIMINNYLKLFNELVD